MTDGLMDDSRSTPVLEVENASKEYPGGVQALRRTSLTVHAGELLAIVGPSGSGKSTLLNLMGTLDNPTTGRVLIRGHDVARLPDRRLAAVRARWIGFVFQQFFLTAHLTALDNVATGLLYHGTSTRERRRLARAALERVGLGARVDHLPHQLSGGERQRVAIARAVVGDRQLLLADEPSGALDSVNAEAVMRLVHAACRRGVAGVVVTHDAQLASWADRVVFLRDGRVVDQTAPAPGPESLLEPSPTR
jgi:putative ABC transport system ATP-binding protein